MIVKVLRDNLTNYESRFFYEAEVGERKNVRRITLSDSGGAAVNGTDKNDTEIDTDTEEISETDIDAVDDASPEVETEPEDEFDTAAEGDPNTDPDNGGTEGPDLEQDTDEELGDENGDETAGDGGEDGGVVTEPEDDAVDTDSEDDTDDDSGGDEQEDNGEGLRKRALFSRLRELHEAVGKYIEKLNMMMAYSSDLVVGYREACDAFDELRTYIYDYMLIRFADASYPESMLFYQRVLTAINLILDKLTGIDITGGNSNPNAKQSTKQGKTSKKGLRLLPFKLKQDNKNKEKE